LYTFIVLDLGDATGDFGELLAFSCWRLGWVFCIIFFVIWSAIVGAFLFLNIVGCFLRSSFDFRSGFFNIRFMMTSIAYDRNK